MESLLLSIISQYLKDYVNNFKREQVSLNFLRGQGVIRNLDINVDPINEAIFQSSVPALRFSRIMINTLSVEAPIMSLKTKPITFFIDRLFIEIVEVVDIEKKPPKKTPKKTGSAKYGFIDRVLDCISFEVNRITIALQTLGRLKSNIVGPWSPPVALFELSGARLFCTNHNGFETELDECIRIRQTKRPLLFLNKKLEIEKASMYLVNPESWDAVANELIREISAVDISGLNRSQGARGYVNLKVFSDVPMQMTMCMRKRMDNNFLLGLELGITIEAIKINLRQQCLSELNHFIMGMHFCLFRLDAIQELFGLDPYNEGFVTCSDSVELGAGAGAATGGGIGILGQTIRNPLTSDRRKLRRDQIGKTESDNLDRLEAEMISGGIAADEGDRGDDWHRSSLNSDEDPPHMRFVTVLQINEAQLHLHLDSLHTPFDSPKKHDENVSEEDCKADTKTASASKNKKNHRANHAHKELPAVIILILKGLVHTTVSPEHAASTESAVQTSLRFFSVTGIDQLHYTTLHYTSLHYTTLHCTTLHYTALHYTTL